MYLEKLTFGLIVGTRNIFNAKLAEEARKILLKQMDKWGYEAISSPIRMPKNARIFSQKTVTRLMA